jgi:hypothetical protein
LRLAGRGAGRSFAMLANPAEVRSARQAEDGAPKRAFSVEIKRDSLARGVAGLDHQKSFQSSGAAERNAAYPTSGRLLVRATGTGTNGRLIAAYLASSAQ